MIKTAGIFQIFKYSNIQITKNDQKLITLNIVSFWFISN